MTWQLSAPARRALASVGAVLAVLAFTQLALPGSAGSRGVPTAILFQGVVGGLLVALSAAALVLVYQINRIINFAQIVIGGLGAELTFEFVRYLPRVPFVISVLLGLFLSALLAAVFDLVVGRRFANSPRLVLTVFTIVGSLFLASALSRGLQNLPFLPPSAQRSIGDYVGPEGLAHYLPFPHLGFHVGSFPVRYGFGQVFSVEIAALLLAGLAVFLRKSRAGTAVRAVAENTERAALLGIGVGVLSTLIWVISGVLSGAAAIASGFTGDPTVAFAFFPERLLPALAAAVLGRFRSLPVTVAAAVGIGVVTEATDYALPLDHALVTVGLFVTVAVGLLLQRPGAFRAEQAATSSWQATEEPRPVPRELSGLPGLRVLRYGGLAVAVIGIVVLPYVGSVGLVTSVANVALVAIVGISLVVLTGWAGQVSLGQFAFVAIGAVVAGGLSARFGVPFWFSVPIATVLVIGLAVLVGLPALRVPGLFLAASTFALGAGVDAVLFDNRYFGWLLPTSGVRRPTLVIVSFDNERNMYFLCLAALVGCLALVGGVRRSRIGRLLIASRENGPNVQSFGVDLVRTKLMAFGLSGGLAGFAGALLAFQLRGVSQAGFSPAASFTLFQSAMIGGIGSVTGAMLGSAYGNLPGFFFGTNPVLAFLLPTLPVVVLYTAPGGLISLVQRVRDAGLRIVAQRRQIVVPSLFADYDPDALAHRLIPLAADEEGMGLAALPPDRRWSLPSELHGAAAGVTRARPAESGLLGSAALLDEEPALVAGGPA